MLAQVALREQRGLVRRGGAFVLRRRGKDREPPAFEARERVPDRACALDRVDAQASLGKARDRLRGVIGAEGDDERVAAQGAITHADGLGGRVDGGDLATHEFDSASRGTLARARDRLRVALAYQEPEERRRKDVLCLALDEHDAVALRQEPAQRLGGNHAAKPRAEHQGGSFHARLLRTPGPCRPRSSNR